MEKTMLKLNIGCNDVLMEGWINTDLHPHNGAVQHDARTPFNFTDNSVDFIYSEHFIEHLNEAEGVNFFKEAYRMLKPGGVIRTSTFCIDDLMLNLSNEERWKIYSETLYGGQFKHMSRIEFFNLSVYDAYDHKHMYNVSEMVRNLKKAEFSHFVMPQPGKSSYDELKDLEYRCNSNCIVEAIKT
jgi:predicted SAM-dependent methyltransferase